jgi:hypothetical protein
MSTALQASSSKAFDIEVLLGGIDAMVGAIGVLFEAVPSGCNIEAVLGDVEVWFG